MTTKAKAEQLYRSMGLKPIINAAGPISMYGGSRPRSEVIEAMAEAATVSVEIFELNRAAGKVIAELVGAEAAVVSSGAAGALVLQAAACIAGSDPEKMAQLPDTRGLKNEIIMQRCLRFSYDQGYRVGGGKIVDAGDSDGCRAGELEAAFTDRTAAVAYLFAAHSSRGALPFGEVCEIAHARGVPVIVDAANFLPPRSNLHRFTDEGADMVIFSGGKAVRGPQGAGILAGRADLIEAAAANASPHPYVARGMKVSKEEIIGLIAALRRFVNEDEEAENLRYRELCQRVVDAFIETPGLSVSLEHDERDYLILTAVIRFTEAWRGPSHKQLHAAMGSGDTPIFLRKLGGQDETGADPMSLDDEKVEIVIRRLREELSREGA